MKRLHKKSVDFQKGSIVQKPENATFSTPNLKKRKSTDKKVVCFTLYPCPSLATVTSASAKPEAATSARVASASIIRGARIRRECSTASFEPCLAHEKTPKAKLLWAFGYLLDLRTVSNTKGDRKRQIATRFTLL